jgi:hypothetical protein
VAGGERVVEALEKSWRRPVALGGHRSGHVERGPVGPGVEQQWGGRLPLAPQDHVDGPLRVVEDLIGDERHAVAADDDQTSR